MMETEIQIKQFEMSESDALFSFLRDVYDDNPRQSDPNFWRWRYVDHPLANETDVPVCIAKQGEMIVAQSGGPYAEAVIDGEVERTAWIQDMMTHAAGRRKGLGKKVVSGASRTPLMLGINTMEQHAPAMLQQLGWVIVGKINRYSKLIFPGNAVREISKIAPLRSAVNGVFSLVRSRYKTASTIKRIERFDESFDALWEECQSQWRCSVRRSSEFLNWQYVEQPGKKFDIFAMYGDSGKVRGYIVLFFRKPNAKGIISKAAITDIVYSPTEPQFVVDELLKTALNLAIERRIGSLVTDIVDPLVESRLKHFGFWPVKNPLQLMVKSPDRQDVIYDIKNWFITRGDSDTSIFEDPNL